MDILKKFYEFKTGTGGEELIQKIESPISGELRDLLEDLKLKQQRGENSEVKYRNYTISLPSELNGEGQKLTYLIINDEGQHAQAQSESDVAQVVTEKVLFESFRNRRKR